MDATLTLRLDGALRRKLRARAVALKVSEAEVVRQALNREVNPEPFGKRIANLRGVLRLPRTCDDPWREKIRERNWRP
ncbi:MAG: hypothetical protein EBS05_00695 [Proteobacteria bacterium]|nr:hypothetical protein [Pseudomonadota bacterium]NDF01810.1 hypothetical protein [Verrucomicrobiota bacterium]